MQGLNSQELEQVKKMLELINIANNVIENTLEVDDTGIQVLNMLGGPPFRLISIQFTYAFCM